MEKDFLTTFIETLTKIRRSLNRVLSSQGDVADGSIADFPSKISTIFDSFEKTCEKIGYKYNENDVYIPEFITKGLSYAESLIEGSTDPEGRLVLGYGENAVKESMKGDLDLIFLPKTTIVGNTAKDMFSGCINLLSTSEISVPKDVTSLEAMFKNCQQLRYVDGLILEEDHEATTVADMFYGCTYIVNIPNYIVQSSCTTLDNIFTQCKSLGNKGAEIVNTATWNTTGLKSFYLGSGLAGGMNLKIDTRGWDFTKATITNAYNVWQAFESFVGDATPDEVHADGVRDKQITAFNNFHEDLDLKNMLASNLNQASLMAFINGAAELPEGETKTFKFYNESQQNKLGDYKEWYLNELTRKGWKYE